MGTVMSRVAFAILAGVLPVLCACQYDPHAGRYTTQEPKDADLVGSYVLEKFFLPAQAGSNAPEIRVELRADGTFAAKNVPPWEFDYPEARFFSWLISGEGKWEKGKVGGRSDGKDLWGIYLRAAGDRFSPAGLTGNEPPYGLIFTLGDPDSGYALLLKRVDGAP